MRHLNAAIPMAAAITLITTLVFAHGGEDHSAPAASPAVSDATSVGFITMAKESQFALGILTERASSRTMVQARRVTGRIVPAANGRAEVFASQSGRIVTSRAWKTGDRVTRGQTLFAVEQTFTGSERLDLERELIEADRELQEATRDYQRKRSLEGVVAKKEIEFAKIRMDGAAERHAALERAVTQGTKPVSVTAPITGTISLSDVVNGEYVDVSKQLMEIVNTSTVWVEAQLFEGDLAAMPRGTTAIVTSPSTVGTFSGSLVTVGNVIDPTTRTAAVIFAVQNRSEQLKINSSANIEISLGTDASVLAVPKAAIVQSGGKAFVVIHRGPEEFEPIEVMSGNASDATHTQIASGIKQGDKIVVTGLSHFRTDLPQ